jgi:hypothetical protein
VAYTEEDSTFSSNGDTYDLNTIFAGTERIKAEHMRVSDYTWMLKDMPKKKEDLERTKRADLDVPILVAKLSGKEIIVDGMHRLSKAHGLGRELILGREVPPEVMQSAKVESLGEASAAKGKMTPAKRKKIVNLILGVVGTMDKTGVNRVRYAKDLGGMSDGELEAKLERMRTDDTSHFYLEVLPFNGSEPGVDQIEAAAKAVGVELHEYVYFRHDGAAEPVRTRVRVPVGYMHVRRLQQILMKKTSYSTDASKRSQVTGQLVGESAVGRMTNQDAYALRTVGATSTLQELLGPRADNRDKRLGMYQAIERDGYVQYSELVGDSRQQQSLNYLSTLFLAAGLRSDLLSDGDLLRVSAERPELSKGVR